MVTERVLFLLSPVIFGAVCLLGGYVITALKQTGNRDQEDEEEDPEKHTSRALSLDKKGRLAGRVHY